MSSTLTLTILTPQRKLIERENIQEIFAPGFKGQLDILPNHADMVTELETGVVRWKTNVGWRSATISTGLLQIQNQEITVLAEVSELAEEIDAARAKVAQEKAKKMLDEGGLDDANFKKYELKLKRSMARVNALGSEH